MIFGFFGSSYIFRRSEPIDEATRLLARMDRIQAFRRFVAAHAPAEEFIQLFLDFEAILQQMIRSHCDWQFNEDLGKELAGILAMHQRRYRNDVTAAGQARLGQAQLEQGLKLEATIQRMIALWNAFAAEEARA